MIVLVRIEVDNLTRRAIRRSKGETGLATREEVRGLVDTAFETSIVDIVADERERQTANCGQSSVPNVFDDLPPKPRG